MSSSRLRNIIALVLVLIVAGYFFLSKINEKQKHGNNNARIESSIAMLPSQS